MRKYVPLFLAVCFMLQINAQTTVTLQPGNSTGKDAHIDDLNANSNNGMYPFINAGYNTVSGTPTLSHDFVQFNLSAIPVGATILSAKLSFYHAPGGDHSNSSDNYELLAKVLGAWDESTITWNNQPGFSTTDTIQIGNTLTTSDDKPNIDVAAFVQYWVNNPALNYGMVMHLVDEPGTLGRFQTYSSSDNADTTLAPKLVITYTACNGHSVVHPAGDAHIDDLNPDSNNGAYPYINAGYNTVGGTPTLSHDFMQFDLSFIPVGATINSAKLSLYNAPGNTHSNSTDNYEMFDKALGPWTESGITWNNQPSLSTTDTIQIGNTLTAMDNKMNIDVAPFIQYWVNNPASNYGMAMRLIDEPGAIGRFQSYASRDNADSTLWPTLVIDWTGCTTGLNELQSDKVLYEIYPNPTNGILNIRNDKNEAVDVTVYDISGRRLLEAQKINSIDVTQLQAGVYLLSIRNRQDTVTKKFIKN